MLLLVQDINTGLPAAGCLFNVTMFLSRWGVGERKHWLGAATWGVAGCVQRAASHSVYMCVCVCVFPQNMLQCLLPSVSAPCYTEKVLLGLCSVSSAERDGVFVLTG